MNRSDSIQDIPSPDRNSASSGNRLINDYNRNTNGSNDDVLSQQTSSTSNTKEYTEKLKADQRSTPTESPANQPSFRGPFGITTTSTVVWYICICLLFVIAFLCLVLSILYFVTDTSTDQVLKLYGICGAGGLAIVTFVIVFLDCCNDSSRKDHEQEIIYKTLQAKDEQERQLALRRRRRIAQGKEERPRPFLIQHKRSQNLVSEPPPPHLHHHHHPHHFPLHPPTSYHHPFVCPVCHDLHASGNARHNISDVGVDTSDKFEPVYKKTKVVHKSTRDVQTEGKYYDAERGTQTDRTEGTQTSVMELSGIPSNVAQIIHETTILKAPRSLINTLKKSMAEQDREIAMTHAVTGTNTTSKNII